jgi:hypothetical protein
VTRLGLGLLQLSFVGGLAAESAVGPVVVVVVLPFLEFLAEQASVVLGDTVEQSVELFGVDAVRMLDFAVKGGGLLDYVLSRLPFQIEKIQTDNGAEFQSSFHWHALDQGIGHVYIRPN